MKLSLRFGRLVFKTFGSKLLREGIKVYKINLRVMSYLQSGNKWRDSWIV
jgi:hypothetical protein